MWNKKCKTVLALGADMKNRFLIARGGSLSCGPDIGDLSQAKNYALFKKEVRKALKRKKPDIIACDLHPDFFSSRFAQEYSLQLTAYSLQLIQHHHAHIASVIQEHNLKRPVIGIAFDGTGFGQDGNSWGGEFLLVRGSQVKRLAHLKYRMTPGVDKVVWEPWRMALSILGRKAFPFLKGVKKGDKELILAMLAKNINSPLSSSAGRLFDAAASLLGLCLYASYEAEGPMKLQALCDQKINQHYEFEVTKGNGAYIIDTDGLFLGMLQDLKRGRDKAFLASKFHNSFAEIIVSMAKKLSRALNIKDLALSGGVFQNGFLTTKVMKKMSGSRLNVFTNMQTPLNDLNISLGQYYVSGF